MFEQTVSGVYKESVHFFAGTAEGLVHVTFHDGNRNNLFYDFMTDITSHEQFNEQLNIMCEDYLKRFINGKRISEGQEDNESILQSIPTVEVVSTEMET
jgi:hypothetical protein